LEETDVSVFRVVALCTLKSDEAHFRKFDNCLPIYTASRPKNAIWNRKRI